MLYWPVNQTLYQWPVLVERQLIPSAVGACGLGCSYCGGFGAGNEYSFGSGLICVSSSTFAQPRISSLVRNAISSGGVLTSFPMTTAGVPYALISRARLNVPSPFSVPASATEWTPSRAPTQTNRSTPDANSSMQAEAQVSSVPTSVRMLFMRITRAIIADGASIPPDELSTMVSVFRP